MADEFTDNCFASDHVVQTDMANIEKNFATLKSAFSGAAAPSSADLEAGQWWYDTNNNILKLRVGSAWQSVWDFGENCPCFGLLGTVTDTNKRISLAMMNDASKDPVAGTAGLRSIGTTGVTACAGNDSRLTNHSMVIGDNLIGSNDTAKSTTNTSYTLLKAFSIIQDGNYRIKFNLKALVGVTVYAKIYKNSVTIGTQRSTSSTSYVNFSEDINSWAKGDQCELRVYTSNGADPASVSNFRLYVGVATLGAPASLL